MDKNDELLTPEAVAEKLGVALTTLQTWRARRVGPPSIRVGHRTVRYSAAALQRWLESREQRADG